MFAKYDSGGQRIKKMIMNDSNEEQVKKKKKKRTLTLLKFAFYRVILWIYALDVRSSLAPYRDPDRNSLLR